jgi:two-component sensor histidine kinase
MISNGTDQDKIAAEETILIFAPLGRDAELISATLCASGYGCETCRSEFDLVRRIEEGVGALVLTSEAVDRCDLKAVGAAVRRQAPWSDLPVVFVSNADTRQISHVTQELGNVLAITRPTSPQTILSTVESCLRGRRRQYAFRDLLEQVERQNAEIGSLNEQLVRSMRETHHRVKNNLQMVAALVDMRCLDGVENLTLDEFRRIGAHVQMLAAVHDILTGQAREGGSGHHVSARQIFDMLLPKIQITSPTCEITFESDDLTLTIRQATAVSLLLFELVANAVKYANGHADVRLRAEANTATLTVTDDGAGFPPGFNPAVAAHTGLDLVENISRWDLRGATRYEGIAGGGRVTITFPVSVEDS